MLRRVPARETAGTIIFHAGGGSMAVIEFLKEWSKTFNADAAAGANHTIQFKTGQPAYVTIKDGTCTLTEGNAPSADVTLVMADEDLVALLKGELNGMMAFMTGKLQLEGDMMLAQKLGNYFPRK